MAEATVFTRGPGDPRPGVVDRHVRVHRSGDRQARAAGQEVPRPGPRQDPQRHEQDRPCRPSRRRPSGAGRRRRRRRTMAPTSAAGDNGPRRQDQAVRAQAHVGRTRRRCSWSWSATTSSCSPTPRPADTNVVYRRNDGHYGLIEPVDDADVAGLPRPLRPAPERHGERPVRQASPEACRLASAHDQDRRQAAARRRRQAPEGARESRSAEVTALEPRDQPRSRDEQLRAKTAEFRERLANGETLDDLLLEAFAVVREAGQARARHAPLRRAAHGRHRAARRRHRRDEDRRRQDARRHPARCTSTRSPGAASHLVTVNDYLAKRDAEWMGQVYRVPGPRRSASSRHSMEPDAAPRRRTTPTSPTAPTPSSASTTCATTWPCAATQLVQRGHSLLHRRRGRLDPHRRGAHAAHHRGRARDGRRASTATFATSSRGCIAGRGLRGRREAAHRGRHRGRRRQGREGARTSTTSTRTPTASWSTTSTQALRAQALYHKDVEYVVKDGEVLIVDEFTGRILTAAATPRACTRPSRPRRSVPIRRRTRPSPPSPSRTTSASTRSSPA